MRAAYGKGYCDALTEDARARSASTTGTACPRAGSSRSGTSRPVESGEGFALERGQPFLWP